MSTGYYKWIRPDGSTVCAPNNSESGAPHFWPLPQGEEPGDWCPPIEGELKPGNRGYHVCRVSDLCGWCLAETDLYEVELRGDTAEDEYRVVGREARLFRKIPGWETETKLWFAVHCASEAVLGAFGDKPPQEAVLLLELTWGRGLHTPVAHFCRGVLESRPFGNPIEHAAIAAVLAASRPSGPHTLAAASYTWCHVTPPEWRRFMRGVLSQRLATQLGIEL
jgi:hypothetical protein